MTNLEKEQLLEEARKKYPVGTIFKIAHKPSLVGQITGNLKWGTNNNIFGVNFTMASEPNDGAVYADGLWAEIVSYPEGYIPETNNNLILAL